MLNFDSSNSRPLRELVYEELKLQIMTGKILPGSRMMEVDLAKENDVSRTPVREAIRQLEKEGLVTIKPRKGAYVSEISTRELIETLEVFQNMEGLAAYFATFRIKSDQMRKLKKASKDYDLAVSEENIENAIRYDDYFHRIITDSSNNKFLIQMIDTLQERVLRFRHIYHEKFRQSTDMSYEHKRIVKAIEEHDADSAREAACMHIDGLKSAII